MKLLPSFFILVFIVTANGECVARLPTADVIKETSRIVNGLQAAPSDFDNIVTIAQESEEGLDYFCVGSLVAPEWVITAAQCFIRPNVHFVLRGSTSFGSARFEIASTHTHRGFDQAIDVHRDDIQLVKLRSPVPDTVQSSPTPSPSPAPGTEPQPPSQQAPTTQPGPPRINTNFNFMYINNNTDFAMDEPRYLRLKGFGITTQPNQASEPLRFRPRDLHFADLRTAPCDDSFGNDAQRRLCTERDDSCGACYGDVGAPLYDVDRSGTFSVLVGIVTFGEFAVSFENPICTGRKPVAYTAVARYADWIRNTITESSGEERVFFFQLPKEGITDTDLARDNSPIAIFATTSVIVISCLALLGTIVALIITCVVRHLRRKRKRWLEGLQAEESFVKAGEHDAIIVDPFEGIQKDQQPRFSFTGFSRAAVKGATEFSSRSIGMLKALVARDKDEDFFEPREAIENAPTWVPGAWDKLFMPPSKKDLQKIHKIPTQRVVDDVLSGADKSVELSLEEVAYKAKRDEANLEAAWAKLEVQTSLRNLSEAGASAAGSSLFTPSVMSPSGTPVAASPRKGSRNSSRAMSPLGSGKRKPGDLTKADTLLAAFASIDAESEQVAEETTIDSSALRALAEAKRPNVLATLRRKFSNGQNTPSMRSNDRESDGEEVRVLGNVRDPASPLNARGTGRHGGSGSRLGSGRNSRAPTPLSSVSGLVLKPSLGSRQSSMLMDYFSEDYSVSNSGSDEDEQVEFEDMFDTSNRRYTEDRKPQTPQENRSILSFRSMRKSQNRSFESLERTNSSDNMSNSQGSDVLSDLPASPREPARPGPNEKSTLPTDKEHRSLPISTSSVSSDKRPRTSADHYRAGPSGGTQIYSEHVTGQEERVSVHMEGESLSAMHNPLPDRAELHQSSRLPSTKDHLVIGGRIGMQSERPAPSADGISVHMEEETSAKGRCKGSRSGIEMQDRALSEANTSQDHERISHQGSFEREDVSSVHMEEAPLGTKPTGQTRKAKPSTDVPRSGVSESRLIVPKQDHAIEDRVSVYMEEEPSFEKGGETNRKQHREDAGNSSAPKKLRPASETISSTTRLFGKGNAPSVHMEDETTARLSVRARINAFDESEKRARHLSEPLLSASRGGSSVSVAKLKNMWNEIARRNSEDSE